MTREQIDRLFKLAYTAGWHNGQDGSYHLTPEAWSWKRAQEEFRKVAQEFEDV